MYNRGVVVTFIIAIIALLMLLSLMGFFRADQRPYGFSFKQALNLPCGVRVYAPKKNAVVASPFTVRGYANGCGWVPDADNRIGTLDIVAENGVYFGSYVLRAKGDLTSAPYYFDGVVAPIIPYSAENGKFIFTPYAPNGKQEVIPVKFR